MYYSTLGPISDLVLSSLRSAYYLMPPEFSVAKMPPDGQPCFRKVAESYLVFITNFDNGRATADHACIHAPTE